MANGFTDDQLSRAIEGALGVGVAANFLPSSIFPYNINPETNPSYDTPGSFPWGDEPTFALQNGYENYTMSPGFPGVYQNSSECRWTNNEVGEITITHFLVVYNKGAAWFTIELGTPVAVAAGGTLKRYVGTIIAKISR